MTTDGQMEQWRKRVRTHLLQSAQTKISTAEECMESILQGVEAIVTAFRNGGKVLLCGNGGSAADCQHMATEFVCRLRKGVERPGLPAIALTTNSSFITAYANDYDFEGVFGRAVDALGKAGDVLLGISTSGVSPNIIRAVEVARKKGVATIALTGHSGRLAAIADIAICIPHDDTQFIQEVHLAVEHIMCDLIESCLFPQPTKGDHAIPSA